MHFTKLLCIFILIIQSAFVFAQEKFKVVERETGSWNIIFELVNENNETIRTLDTNKYFPLSINDDKFGYFAVFAMHDSVGFYAIDSQENILFKVYNTTIGEPNPDVLIENKIRIINQFNKIGYANEKGQIIIPPQFEIATHFNNDKAIVGVNCTESSLNNHGDECMHITINCKKHGYINQDGRIQKMTTLSFEELAKEIRWK